MQMRNLPITLGILILLALSTLASAQQKDVPPPDPQQFDPMYGAIVATSDGVVAWSRFDMVPSSAGHVRRSYFSKYFIQRLNDGAKPVLAARGLQPPMDGPVAILPNETLLVSRRDIPFQPDALYWLRGGAVQRQVPLKIDGAAPTVRAIFPDGIVAESRDLWWIPIQDGQINVTVRFKIGTILGGDGFTKFERHENEIAWSDTSNWPRNLGPHDHPSRPLYIFDIARRTTRSVELRGSEHHLPHDILAFDGHHAIDGLAIIDVASGQTKELNNYFEAIGIINNVAFGVEKKKYEAFELLAMHLDQPDRREVIHRIDKAKLSPKRPDLAPFEGLFFVQGSAVYAWNGATWENILAKK